MLDFSIVFDWFFGKWRILFLGKVSYVVRFDVSGGACNFSRGRGFIGRSF